MNNALTPEPHDSSGLNPTNPEQEFPAPQSAWANHTPVFLVGMMGAGKTTIGKSLAKALHREFLDLDHELEARCGVRIPTIFEIEGEAGFRKRETAAIQSLCELNNIVMATGGGAVLAPENRDMLKKHGSIIYLRANVHDLWHRTRNDKTRPLLQGGNIKNKIEQLHQVRHPIYTEMADFIVDTGVQSALDICQQIEQLIKATLPNKT